MSVTHEELNEWTEKDQSDLWAEIDSRGPHALVLYFPFERADLDGTRELLRHSIIGKESYESYFGVNAATFDTFVDKQINSVQKKNTQTFDM